MTNLKSNQLGYSDGVLSNFLQTQTNSMINGLKYTFRIDCSEFFKKKCWAY